MHDLECQQQVSAMSVSVGHTHSATHHKLIWGLCLRVSGLASQEAECLVEAFFASGAIASPGSLDCASFSQIQESLGLVALGLVDASMHFCWHWDAG